MGNEPKVTVLIPHHNGEEILSRCLTSLRATLYDGFQVIVVDNGSTDGSREMIRSKFPEVELVESASNLGFAGGCNLGIRRSSSPYVVLLNNDTEVAPNWLTPMVETAESNPSVGAVQPKVLSILDRERFDYCGAAGGEIDLFGYPFAWGRLFDTMEMDQGQYDRPRQVFWASGAATLLRRSALRVVGLLEERFFAHMEEIDLNWRLQWAGYRTVTSPEAVVYHQTGATMDSESFQKMLLNHRNNLLMLLRNHTLPALLWIFPMRLMLEGVTVIRSLVCGEPKRALAVILALCGLVSRFRCVSEGSRIVRSIRAIKEGELLHRMYRGSVAFSYFIGHRRRTGDLYV